MSESVQECDAGLEAARQTLVERDEIFHANWGRRFREWLDDPGANAAHWVVSVITEAAIAYLRGELDADEACLFEEFFTSSAAFRRKVVGYVAFMDSADMRRLRSLPRGAASEAEWIEVQVRASRWCMFDALQTPELVAEAQWLWDAAAAGSGLPPVDLTTGRVVEEDRPVSLLSDGALIRSWLEHRRGPTEIVHEMQRRIHADPRFAELTTMKHRAWQLVRQAVGEGETR